MRAVDHGAVNEALGAMESASQTVVRLLDALVADVDQKQARVAPNRDIFN